ncbi:MAG: hypothetical protein ACYDC9_01800 [Dermatophilaceae bacterium]
MQRILAGQQYFTLADFWHRAQVSRPVVERLVMAGGFDSLYGLSGTTVSSSSGMTGRRGRVTRRDPGRDGRIAPPGAGTCLGVQTVALCGHQTCWRRCLGLPQAAQGGLRRPRQRCSAAQAVACQPRKFRALGWM